MPEQQNIEYKASWRDEYLRWICGFANAQGGTLVIGKNDNGNIVGVKKSDKLLEDLPNKITSILGIVSDVNLHETKQGDFIEIVVEPQPNPVNYKGEYHYRSGSTKQELKGAALDKFLLQKYGKKWDSVVIPNVPVADLKQETFDFFRKKGIKSKRLNDDVLTDSNELLLENLQLTENNHLKRAAILLFHPNPEKFVTGAYVKIGYFETDGDLIYQDEIHGNLFEQVEKTIDLLFTKYIKALISYEGIYRIETYEYPKEAVREAIHNAIAHKDYTGATPIQISVYKDKIMIWNYGELPENWTIETLQKKHSSIPHNSGISNAFFRIGYIEAWGRGIWKMNQQCAKAGLPQPLYYYESSGFWVVFRKDTYNEQTLKELGLSERQIKAVLYVKEKGKITNKEYQGLNNVISRTALRDLDNLIFKDVLKRSGEGKNIFYTISMS
ncbi:MAG: putative DNA binding domain-containing protein [Flavobacteriaceae bacterium]|jgi:ATP-dependent DNA helicase RecG|nr:putative DNA binding domain-containing protein [Flavobacteriaceae bacterium]